MADFSLAKVNHYVLRKQHLTHDSKINDVVQIVKDIGGLHATSAAGPYLSLFVRAMEFEKTTLTKELSYRKTLARIRYVRNTVYILPKEFIPVAFAATTGLAGMTSERYYRHLGITPGGYERISRKILNVLKGRGLSTREIKGKLRTARNIAPIVNLMCDRGLLIRGIPKEGWRSTQHTYYRFEDYYPDLKLREIDQDTARKAVIKQYISSFGPVNELDVAWWTGFPKGQVKKMLEDLKEDISSVEISGLDGKFFLRTSEWEALNSLGPPSKRVIGLLPGLDTYLMGFKNRERYLDPQQYEMIFDRSGNATSTILVDGRIVGVWDFDEPWVKVYLLKEMDEEALSEIYSQAADLGGFIADRKVQVKRCDSMVPLTQRTAGSFMAPLKEF
jgi:hypothetical protein